jgi:hypothetical protein
MQKLKKIITSLVIISSFSSSTLFGFSLNQIVNGKVTTNILTNHSFEEPLTKEGKMVGWHNLLNTHSIIRTEEPKAQDGKNYLMGGQEKETAVFQSVRLDQYLSTEYIDSGKAIAICSGYLHNRLYQKDSVEISVIFYTLDNKPLGKYTIGTLKKDWQHWSYNHINAKIPKGARIISYLYTSVRQDGIDNDGYFDNANIALTLPMK